MRSDGLDLHVMESEEDPEVATETNIDATDQAQGIGMKFLLDEF